MVRNKQGEFEPVTGNQTGVLLLDYLIGAMKRAGKLPANALELYLALGHGAAAYAGVAVYLSGFASYGAMGFSPSIWASGARSGFFFAFALAAAGALVLRALPEKRMPWRVFGCTAAVCALAQCLSLLGA